MVRVTVNNVDGSTGFGSGFLVSKDGLVITANHVVDNKETATVHLADGRTAEATVLGRAFGRDIAVLSTDLSVASTLSLGDSSTLSVGDQVTKIGFGGILEGEATVAAGIVSALRENDRNAITYVQTDAPVNPGDSGGVLLNETGDVVGVIAAKFVSLAIEGLGFAVSTNDFSSDFETLAQGEDVCQSAPESLRGDLATNPTYHYKITIPRQSGWEHVVEDRTMFVGKTPAGAPGNRRAGQSSSGVNIWVTLRSPISLRPYLDSWISAYQDSYDSMFVLDMNPVCVPSLGVTEALEVEVWSITEPYLAPDRERWLTFFHGGLAYFIQGYAWDIEWEEKEPYIDSLMYSINFD